MKKIKYIVICGIIAGIVFAMVKCFVIVGRVIDVEEHTFNITCDDAGRTIVLSIPTSYIQSSIKQNDTVIIIYTGSILETYPEKLQKIIYVFKM